jgi:catechol 2,3-dioxygenase-like lactoylglutathione lyase family enzyme
MKTLQSSTPVAFLYVRDRERMLNFYVERLGCRLRSADAFGDFIDLGAALLRVTVMANHTASPHPVLGWNVGDIVSMVQRLREGGIVFTIHEGMGQDALGIWTSPDDGSKVAFFADPDGNVLMLSQT